MKQEKTFKVTISKVNEQLFNGDAHSVTFPGSEGQLTILAQHEALITLLKKGTIIVRTDSGEKNFDVLKGLIEVSNGQATVLV
jgi:F-type H+-transporting ATPase subunit epsilon